MTVTPRQRLEAAQVEYQRVQAGLAEIRRQMNATGGAGTERQRSEVAELHRKLGGLEFDVRRLEAEVRGGKVEVSPVEAGAIIAEAERRRRRAT